MRESEAEREREEGGGENKKKKKKKKNNRVILENSEELNYELSAIGWQSPTDLLAVLLFDAHPFDWFVSKNDGEAVEGGHDDAGR